MKVSNLYPSKFLKADDLGGKTHLVTIDTIAIEDIGDGNKPVVYFQNREKGVVLNKTNSNSIASAFGDETDDWPGKQVELRPATTEFQGRTVPCIRIFPHLELADELDDSVPFF